MPFEFYEDSGGEHRWRLRSANGEVVATGEGHASEADAKRAATTSVFVGLDGLEEMAAERELRALADD